MYVILVHPDNLFLTDKQYPETYSARQDYAKQYRFLTNAIDAAADLTVETGKYHYIQAV